MQVSLEELDDFAAQFWTYVNDRRVFAFHGPMGAGKTTMITALGRKKGVTESMSSPTFSIINQYSYAEKGAARTFYHIDLYRLETADEAVQAGVEESMYSGEICMVEWPEKAADLFDQETTHVRIMPVEERLRIVQIELPNNNRIL